MKLNKPFYTYFVLCTLCFVLFTSISFSQEKNQIEIKKSNTIEKINGVKYYMHTVEKGQTLFAIAKSYDISLNDIVLENPEAIDGIQPGQILKIPTKKPKKKDIVVTPEGGDYIVYKVEAGQTLYSIAKQYKTTVEKIKSLNPELQDGLKGGQMLKIPATKEQVESSKTEKTKATTTVSEMDSDMDSTHSTPYAGKIKEEYNIAFFLPFHANEANELSTEKIIKGDEKLPAKSEIALPFYEGAMLAIDSLKRSGLKAKIFIYDIDDSDSLNIVGLLKRPELKEMNLMIGPLYGSSFMPIAKFAKEHSIPIVSPFTQINKILFDNLYVCKVLPSSAMQIELMANYVVDSFRTQNLILLNNGNPKEVTFYNAFKKAGNKALKKAGGAAVDTLREAKSLNVIESMLNPSKTNVVVLPSNNQSYVTEFISKLNKAPDKNKIVVFGLQSWLNFDNLDFEYLNKLAVHIPSNNFIDYRDLSTKNFVRAYRDKFRTEPELYAFQGYDITSYFISLLQKYGSGFLNNIVDDKNKGIEIDFNFMQYPMESGFENKFVYILKYEDYKLVKAN
jgi:LysM repeat protein/ABC-type branched-subunit amino acid transport system substrate-binding protein